MQREFRTALLVSAATMVAAACSDRSTSTVTAPQTPRATVAGTLALTCDPGALVPLASAYAASASDPLFAIIAGLQSAGFHGATPATTDLVFDGLSRLAAIRGTSAQKGGATGATFDALTKGLLGCAESYIAATVPSTFSVAGALGAGWLYEVRGDNGQDGAAGAYARGSSPYWAAEPQAGHTWGNTLVVTAPAGSTPTNRVLIYGFRLGDYSTLDPKIGSAFEIATVPTVASGVLALVPSLHIGLCNVDLDATFRVQHVITVLPNAGLACGTPPAFASASATSGASFARSMLNPLRLATKAVSFFAPATLEAAFIVGSVGGAVSELSPSAVIDMQAVTMDFDLAVKDGKTSEPLEGADGGPVKVSVGTLNGSPLKAASVTLTIGGNNGKPALFKDGSAAPSETVTRVTDANGVATFTGVSVTKAGGYRLTATGNFDGVDGVPVTSSLFNIKNK